MMMKHGFDVIHLRTWFGFETLYHPPFARPNANDTFQKSHILNYFEVIEVTGPEFLHNLKTTDVIFIQGA